MSIEALVLITAAWCGPCKAPEAAARRLNVPVAEVSESMRNVRGIPTLVNERGEIVAVGEEEVVKVLKQKEGN